MLWLTIGIAVDLSKEKLAALVGMKARLWNFMPSHDHLVIRFVDRNSAELFLVLSGCEELAAPVFWEVQDPQYAAVSDDLFSFTDNRVRIVCRDAVLQQRYVRPK